MTNIDVYNDDADTLVAFADKTGYSVAEVVNALLDYLDELEAEYEKENN